MVGRQGGLELPWSNLFRSCYDVWHGGRFWSSPWPRGGKAGGDMLHLGSHVEVWEFKRKVVCVTYIMRRWLRHHESFAHQPWLGRTSFHLAIIAIASNAPAAVSSLSSPQHGFRFMPPSWWSCRCTEIGFCEDILLFTSRYRTTFVVRASLALPLAIIVVVHCGGWLLSFGAWCWL